MKLLLCFLLSVFCFPAIAADTTAAVTINATATSIIASPGVRRWVIISVPSTAARAVFVALNNASVTTTTGHEISPGDTFVFVNPSSTRPTIHGICASSTVDIVVSTGD